MKSNHLLSAATASIFAGLILSTNVIADPSNNAFKDGSYIAPMAVFVSSNDDGELDSGNGGAIALGFRRDFYAVEVVPSLVDLDGTDVLSLALNGLVFPIDDNGFYLSLGLSATNYKDYPVPDDLEDFSTVNVDAGLGYLFPLSLGEKDFAIRAEARYRISHREEEYNDADTDLAVPGDLKHTIFSIGVQIPFGG